MVLVYLFIYDFNVNAFFNLLSEIRGDFKVWCYSFNFTYKNIGLLYSLTLSIIPHYMTNAMQYSFIGRAIANAVEG